MKSAGLRNRRIAAVTACCLALNVRVVSAQPAADAKLSEQIREIAAPLAAKKLFAGVVLVERSDGSRTIESFGLADVESNRPVTPETRFCIASITKPMTQLVFAQLVTEGKVRGEDAVAKFLPAFPKGPSGGSATVQMLLDHRGGVPHRVTTPIEEVERWAPERIVARVAETKLEFEPGSRRSYSSAGYTCLARIAEVVEGKPFGRIMRDRVFGPAGMSNAVDPEPRETVSNAARDYLYNAGPNFEPALERAQPRDYAFLTGAGSVWATADDLARFVNALRGGKFGEGVLEQMLSSQSGVWRGWDGGTGSFASFLEIGRSSGTIVVSLSNIRNGAFHELPARLHELADTGQVRAVRLPPQPIVDDALVQEVCGSYACGGDTLYNVEKRGSGVLVQDSCAYPISGGKLYWPYWYAELRPVRDQAGRVTALEAVTSGRTLRCERK